MLRPDPATLRGLGASAILAPMGSMSFGEMLSISIAMPILLVLSFVVVGQALERLFAYWVKLRLPSAMWEKVRDRLEAGDKAGALAAARRDPSILGAALAAMLARENATTEKMVEGFQLYRQ